MAGGQIPFYAGGPLGFILVRDVDIQMSASPFNNPSTTAHGFVPPLSNLANTYLSGVGTWTEILSTLPPSGVVAGTYGDSSHVPQISVDGLGRVYNAVNVPISGGGGGGGQYMPVVVGGLVMTAGLEILALPWVVPAS